MLIRVKAVQDNSGHWFVIPSELKNAFYIDLYNEDMVDSGEFDDKYGRYRTGGDLNLIPLYADLDNKNKEDKHIIKIDTKFFDVDEYYKEEDSE